MEPQHMTVDVPVGTLDVLDWCAIGAERGTVLALHGFPESPWEWEAVAGTLTRQGLRVVAPAQRGYSAGARPEDVGEYAIEHLSADALAVVDQLGLDSVHVLGHDWGASVAWWLAGHDPERVSSLTAVSVPHLTEFARALESDPDQRARSAYFALFRQAGKAEDVLLQDGARRLREMFDEHVSEELVARHLHLVGSRAGLTGALNWYRAMRRYDLPDISVPTTYLWGRDDPAIGRTGAEATASRMTGEYRFVPLSGVGHWIPEQAPDVVAAEVLDRVSSDAAPA
ncbi:MULTISPECIES: alpha/beta fold hydrolase [unclassified Dietzia]|uniref:alpha/beta fold hydrolase n=1 Tax=unclassified Dietzia TaxID=2617939 RepID=UPI0015FD2DA9|nr:MULTISPECIES: alpha/beta hydrolase [unclassified Dietzia]MBB1023862.1 alpha/beta hydrolase [Dietzia sp. DQ12-76]MBB1026592.1 alpha/beta hydrolase [Dietzia sp. DQ11-38-2]